MKLDKFLIVIILFVLFILPVSVAAADSNTVTDSLDGKTHYTLEVLDPVKESSEGTEPGGEHGSHVNLGESLPLYSCIPFACMLLSIALLPLVAGTFWHHHFGKISAFWAASMAIPFIISYKGCLHHQGLRYINYSY